MKHTKGPWEDVNLGSDNIWIIDESGNYIAETIGADEEGRYIKDDEEREANAHLIAAAPELLEACNTILNRFGGHVRDYEEMTAGQKLAIERTVEAIRKAEGKN